MRSKFLLVLALGTTMMFSEGCNLQQLLAGLQQQGGSPFGPLGAQQPGIPGIGQQPGPLDGSLQAGLAPFSPDPSALAPGVPGLNPQAPANVPTAPAATPIDPNAATPPPAVAGAVPQATPVGAGPIDPSRLPQLPALPVNDNPLALAPTLPTPPGL